MLTGRAPGNKLAPEWRPGTYGHQNGAQAHIGIGRVPGYIWAPKWCPVTYGHQNGARINIGTGRVPGTYENQNGAWAKITGIVPGHICAPE